MGKMQVRDNRSRDWFYLDNELLEVFGGKSKDDKGLGINAIGVYMVLAKHANNDTQQCKPSYQTIATLLGVSRNTVISAIKTLEKAQIISVGQRTINDNEKLHTTNIYTLLNIKVAKPIPTSEPPSARDALPSASDGIGVVQEMNHPSAPEVPELHSSNYTNSNKTTRTTKPPLVLDEKAATRKELRDLIARPNETFINGGTNQLIHKLTDTYPAEWITAVCGIAAGNNANLNYVKAILEHWHKHEFECKCKNPTGEKPDPAKQANLRAHEELDNQAQQQAYFNSVSRRKELIAKAQAEAQVRIAV
jgi:DNA-binding Lrp family transcriptional regulator